MSLKLKFKLTEKISMCTMEGGDVLFQIGL